MKKNLYKYIAMFMTCLLLLQSAMAGQNTAVPLSFSFENEWCNGIDMTHSIEKVGCLTEPIENHGKSAQHCNSTLLCDLACASVTIALPFFEFDALHLNSEIIATAYDEQYRSLHYSPPVPPPLSA